LVLAAVADTSLAPAAARQTTLALESTGVGQIMIAPVTSVDIRVAMEAVNAEVAARVRDNATPGRFWTAVVVKQLAVAAVPGPARLVFAPHLKLARIRL
jgi:hypothetical protein